MAARGDLPGNGGRPMHVNWDPMDEQLRSAKQRQEESVQAEFAEQEHVRKALHEETADIAAALLDLHQRLANAGFQAVAQAIPPDYGVKVDKYSVGIQVNLAGPSWLVMNDGRQTDEIIYNGDRDRGYWALAVDPTTRIDLGAYFGKQFSAFVDRVREERERQAGFSRS
jgi:hypothetical protein